MNNEELNNLAHSLAAYFARQVLTMYSRHIGDDMTYVGSKPHLNDNERKLLDSSIRYLEATGQIERQDGAPDRVRVVDVDGQERR